MADYLSSEDYKSIFEGSGSFEMSSQFAAPFTTYILSRAVGIDEETYRTILDKSSAAVEYIWRGEVGCPATRSNVCNSLEDTSSYLKDKLNRGSPLISNSIIYQMQERGVHVDTISPLLVNILVDGFDPLLHLVNACILSIKTLASDAENAHMRIDEYINENARLLPPFQYCARVATCDMSINGYEVRKGERVMAFIQAANTDPDVFHEPDRISSLNSHTKNLSFGLGNHMCSGLAFSRAVCSPLVEAIRKSLEVRDFCVLESTWTSSVGHNMIDKVYMNIGE